MVTVDQPALEVGDHHRLRRELVVADPRGLDHQQLPAGHPGRDVAGRPDDQLVPRQLGVQVTHLATQRGNRLVDIADGSHS